MGQHDSRTILCQTLWRRNDESGHSMATAPSQLYLHQPRQPLPPIRRRNPLGFSGTSVIHSKLTLVCEPVTSNELEQATTKTAGKRYTSHPFAMRPRKDGTLPRDCGSPPMSQKRDMGAPALWLVGRTARQSRFCGLKTKERPFGGLRLLGAIEQHYECDVVEKRYARRASWTRRLAVNIAITQMARLTTMRIGYSMPKEWR